MHFLNTFRWLQSVDVVRWQAHIMLFYLPHLTSYPPPKAIFSFVGWKKNIIDNFFTLRNFRKKHRVVHTSTWRRCSFFFYCTHFEIYYHEIKLLQFFFVYLFHVFLFIIKKLCREYQNMRILKFFFAASHCNLMPC